jgi:hypothetical protein
MADVLEEVDVGGERLVHGLSITDECIRMVLETGADPERYAAALEGTETIRSYEMVPSGDGRAYFFVEQDPDPQKASLQEFADAMGLVVVPPIEFHDDGVRLLLAGEEEAVRRAFETAPDGLEGTIERLDEYAGRSTAGGDSPSGSARRSRPPSTSATTTCRGRPGSGTSRTASVARRAPRRSTSGARSPGW